MALDYLNINLVLLTVFFAWHYALRCGYISDDHAAIAQRKDIIPDEEKNPLKESYWVKVFNDGIILYYLKQMAWKLHLHKIPFFWHLLSLGIHLTNCYLLYLFLIPLFGIEVAMVAVLFWAVNPMLNQNTVWISGSPYVIGLFFALIAMLSWQNPLVFFLFYALAVMTNISITFVPVLIKIAYPMAWQPNVNLAALALIAFPFIVWKFYRRFTKSLVIDRENFKLKTRKINTFVKVFVYYVYSLFVPVNMGWYHQSGFRYNDRWEKFNYLTLIGFITLAWFTTQGFAGWWFILCILPNSNLYATNSFLQDRYTYVASIGLAVLVAPYLLASPPLFYCVMTFYITRAYMYSRAMRNDETMYRANWHNHPKSDYAVNNLSYFLIQQKRFEEARAVIFRGLEICNTNKMLWYNLGVTHAAEGHFKNDEGKYKFLKALDCWKMALQLEPRWTKPAEDIKKLIQILVDQKVLTLHQEESAQGATVTVPNIIGIKETLQGTK